MYVDHLYTVTVSFKLVTCDAMEIKKKKKKKKPTALPVGLFNSVPNSKLVGLKSSQFSRFLEAG